MNTTLTPEELVAFEDDIIDCFNKKMIRAPIHIDDGNEHQLVEVFAKHVNEDDWVMGSWRTHFKCLLKGVPPSVLKAAILEGRSIGLCFPEYKVISSAIVTGILPIALGTAMGIKRHGGDNKVVCFLGEMTSETGIFHECQKYATNHGLPILFVIEDNGKSVCTLTRDVWNQQRLTYEPKDYQEKSVCKVRDNVLYFKYQSRYPHAGGLSRIQF